MSSYNKSYLDRLARENDFQRDNLEKVIRLSEILQYFNSSKLLSENLVLKGGTAINLTVFQMPRLSTDIDLDFASDCTKEEMLETRKKVNQEILTYMAREGYALKPQSKMPHSLDSWVFGYVNAGGNNDNIKIEINYSDRCHVLPILERSVTIGFLGEVKVKVLSPVELFASKINALLNRCAVRDIYDVYGMLRDRLFESPEQRELLRRVLVFYMAVGSKCKAEEVSLAFENFDHIERLNYPMVRAQLIPVLRKKETFDFMKAKEEVSEFLKDFLIFSDNEQRFVEHFNRREYRPEILFNDDEFVANVRSHPMAHWKCRPNQ